MRRSNNNATVHSWFLVPRVMCHVNFSISTIHQNEDQYSTVVSFTLKRFCVGVRPHYTLTTVLLVVNHLKIMMRKTNTSTNTRRISVTAWKRTIIHRNLIGVNPMLSPRAILLLIQKEIRRFVIEFRL